MGNCDEFLYLGGNEASTHKHVSELLGKETIDTNTFGRSTGAQGNYSTNWQITGRELLTPDEVRMLDNRYALLFIRGERPVQDDKFDVMKHPHLSKTTDGKAPVYVHGKASGATGSVSVESIQWIPEMEGVIEYSIPGTADSNELEFICISEEEIEIYFPSNK